MRTESNKRNRCQIPEMLGKVVPRKMRGNVREKGEKRITKIKCEEKIVTRLNQNEILCGINRACTTLVIYLREYSQHGPSTYPATPRRIKGYTRTLFSAPEDPAMGVE